jgi:hypothetical protein
MHVYCGSDSELRANHRPRTWRPVVHVLHLLAGERRFGQHSVAVCTMTSSRAALAFLTLPTATMSSPWMIRAGPATADRRK